MQKVWLIGQAFCFIYNAYAVILISITAMKRR